MKLFKGARKLEGVKRICHENMWILDEDDLDSGGDTVTIFFPVIGKRMEDLFKAYTGYAVVWYPSGRFDVMAPNETKVTSSSSDEYDNEPWFQSLLDCVYEPKEGE